MRRYGAFALVALLCTAAAPAFAAWENLGSVSFSMRDNHGSTVANIHGDRIALTSRRGDVFCRSVDAVFGNGVSRPVYRGMISGGRTVNVELRHMRNVRQLNFDCRPVGQWRARVDVAANTFGPGMHRPLG